MGLGGAAIISQRGKAGVDGSGGIADEGTGGEDPQSILSDQVVAGVVEDAITKTIRSHIGARCSGNVTRDNAIADDRYCCIVHNPIVGNATPKVSSIINNRTVLYQENC